MLKLENVKKIYNDKIILNNINLEIKKGERVVIIGPSGSGKSTILRCISELEKIDGGVIYFNGKDISTNDSKEVKNKIGMVFQSFNLFNNLSVFNNIVLAPKKLLIDKEKNIDNKALKLLKRFGLKDKCESSPSGLSGGQKQRIAIIRAMMMNPEIILFDEPTSALDPEMTEEVFNVMNELANDGMTMVVVSHEISFVKKFATRVIFVDGGKIVEDGEVDEIFNKAKSERLNDFLKKASIN